MLAERDARYLDFRPELTDRGDLKRRIETDAGVQAREEALTAAFDAWWTAHRERVANLPETRALMPLRAGLLASFEQALAPAGLLDRFQVAGAVATWWGEVVFDLKTLMARGFPGVVQGWAATITTALEDGGRNDPLDYKLVRRLQPQFLDQIAEAEGQVAELDGRLKAATAPGNDEAADEAEQDETEALTEEELKALKKDLSAAKGPLKALRKGFPDRLQVAQAGLDADQARDLVLGILRDHLARELDRRVAARRQALIAAVEGWWDKYRVTLRDIEGERDAARGMLEGFLRGLGYVR